MLPELIQSKSRPPQETAGCIIEGGNLRAERAGYRLRRRKLMKKFTAAVIQMDSGNDVDQNLKELERFIEEAAEKNAKLIAMPENVNYVGDESE